jgi:hypothetical protein
LAKRLKNGLNLTAMKLKATKYSASEASESEANEPANSVGEHKYLVRSKQLDIAFLQR